MQLVTIPFSHYNERARWALQHFGVHAHERRYLPIFHMLGVWKATTPSDRAQDKASSPYSTPVLVPDEGPAVPDSGAIVRWAENAYADGTNALYPAAHRDAIEAFEQELHDGLGRDTRLIAYWFILNDAATFSAVVRANVGPVQRAAFSVLAPLAKAGLRKRMNVTEPSFEKARTRTRARLEDLGSRFGDRRYLFGDSFTAADLTLASLLSPVLHPLPGYGAPIPPLTPAFEALASEFRATAMGKHSQRMYAEHRPRDAPWTLD